jgi:glycyl-tRNA synthetase beta chain
MSDFLLEIGTEEIPARMLDSASEELSRRMRELLEREHLAEAPKLESYSTPRRLAVVVKGVAASQPDVEETLQGPAVKVAYKDGEPTPAAHAFAKKAGVDISKLERVSTPKGEYLSAKVLRKGRPASELLSELLPKELAGIYWAKNMYWRPGKPERFVRPVRWMVAMLDGSVVPLEFAGITAGKVSRGHRILSQGEVALSVPTDYAPAMEKASVIADRAAREYRIRKALDAATRTVPGARWREDAELLNKVTNLTEFPTVVLGTFESEYLTLPEEVLVTVMRDHQNYFAVEDADGKLAPHFLAVLNTQADAEGAEIIRHGNARVLRARFNDARFFWNTDQKHTLRDRVDWLKNVTFQKELGSYYEKAIRTQHLASLISALVKELRPQFRPGIVHKSALLAKTDLTTELVKEFTELQGIIGGLYAKAQSLDPAIGDAIYDHYKPTSMEDSVPGTLEGAVLAIADKADTIAGMFAIGMIPSGSKDPFALRRAANGVVKILAEHDLPLSIAHLMTDALRQYTTATDVLPDTKPMELTTEQSAKYLESVKAFFRERLEFYLREVKGFAYDVVNAVLASNADNVPDAIRRAEAVTAVRGSEDFDAIAASFKRIKNILKQAEEKKLLSESGSITSLDSFDEGSERKLAQEGYPVMQYISENRGDYAASLAKVATLRGPLDKFFDDVMVMVEDEKARTRRLAMLRGLFDSVNGIADFSEIVTEKKGS